MYLPDQKKIRLVGGHGTHSQVYLVGTLNKNEVKKTSKKEEKTNMTLDWKRISSLPDQKKERLPAHVLLPPSCFEVK
jgi:hypothetical protein